MLSADFPASPPRGHFLTKIYHPNVDASTGAICVNTLKKDWTSETTFAHVLSVIRCLLIVPFPESSLNDEAGKLFMDSYNEYAKRARLMANIHGRQRSLTNGKTTTGQAAADSSFIDEGENKTSSSACGEEENKGALPRSNSSLTAKSDRSLKAINRSGANSTNKASGSKGGNGTCTGKGGSGKGTSDKKSKKKALRRL